MQKTTGSPITGTEFRNLRKGERYFITDQNELRTFERHAKCYAKKNVEKAVNSTGSVNPRSDMRWPTDAELYGKQEPVNVSTRTQERSKMSTCSRVSTVLATVKDDGVDAAWRTAARQAAKTVREPLAAVLRGRLPAGVCGLVLSQLDTEHGEAFLAFVTGHAMSYIPQFSCDAKLNRLAKELRVLGLQFATDKLASAILSPLREQFVEVVKMIPGGE